MTKSEIMTIIKQKISDRFDKPLEKIGDDTHLINELGADSLEMTELLVAIEDRFEIRIEEAGIEKLVTADQIANFLENYLKSTD